MERQIFWNFRETKHYWKLFVAHCLHEIFKVSVKLEQCRNRNRQKGRTHKQGTTTQPTSQLIDEFQKWSPTQVSQPDK